MVFPFFFLLLLNLIRCDGKVILDVNKDQNRACIEKVAAPNFYENNNFQSLNMEINWFNLPVQYPVEIIFQFKTVSNTWTENIQVSEILTTLDLSPYLNQRELCSFQGGEPSKVQVFIGRLHFGVLEDVLYFLKEMCSDQKTNIFAT